VQVLYQVQRRQKQNQTTMTQQQQQQAAVLMATCLLNLLRLLLLPAPTRRSCQTCSGTSSCTVRGAWLNYLKPVLVAKSYSPSAAGWQAPLSCVHLAMDVMSLCRSLKQMSTRFLLPLLMLMLQGVLWTSFMPCLT
jgi:hypothetical protein